MEGLGDTVDAEFGAGVRSVSRRPHDTPGLTDAAKLCNRLGRHALHFNDSRIGHQPALLKLHVPSRGAVRFIHSERAKHA